MKIPRLRLQPAQQQREIGEPPGLHVDDLALNSTTARPPSPLLRRVDANGRSREISTATPNGRSWPKAPVYEPELNGRCRAKQKLTFRWTRNRERSPVVRLNLRGQIAGDTGQSAWRQAFKDFGGRGQMLGGL
jgi:hypothetical protein